MFSTGHRWVRLRESGYVSLSAKRTDPTIRNVTFYTTDPWGLLQKKVRFETYLPVGTFPRGWYVLEGNYIMKIM